MSAFRRDEQNSTSPAAGATDEEHGPRSQAKPLADVLQTRYAHGTSSSAAQPLIRRITRSSEDHLPLRTAVQRRWTVRPWQRPWPMLLYLQRRRRTDGTMAQMGATTPRPEIDRAQHSTTMYSGTDANRPAPPTVMRSTWSRRETDRAHAPDVLPTHGVGPADPPIPMAATDIPFVLSSAGAPASSLSSAGQGNLSTRLLQRRSTSSGRDSVSIRIVQRATGMPMSGRSIPSAGSIQSSARAFGVASPVVATPLGVHPVAPFVQASGQAASVTRPAMLPQQASQPTLVQRSMVGGRGAGHPPAVEQPTTMVRSGIGKHGSSAGSAAPVVVGAHSGSMAPVIQASLVPLATEGFVQESGGSSSLVSSGETDDALVAGQGTATEHAARVTTPAPSTRLLRTIESGLPIGNPTVGARPSGAHSSHMAAPSQVDPTVSRREAWQRITDGRMSTTMPMAVRSPWRLPRPSGVTWLQPMTAMGVALHRSSGGGGRGQQEIQRASGAFSEPLQPEQWRSTMMPPHQVHVAAPTSGQPAHHALSSSRIAAQLPTIQRAYREPTLAPSSADVGRSLQPLRRAMRPAKQTLGVMRTAGNMQANRTHSPGLGRASVSQRAIATADRIATGQSPATTAGGPSAPTVRTAAATPSPIEADVRAPLLQQQLMHQPPLAGRVEAEKPGVTQPAQIQRAVGQTASAAPLGVATTRTTRYAEPASTTAQRPLEGSGPPVVVKTAGAPAAVVQRAKAVRLPLSTSSVASHHESPQPLAPGLNMGSPRASATNIILMAQSRPIQIHAQRLDVAQGAATQSGKVVQRGETAQTAVAAKQTSATQHTLVPPTTASMIASRVLSRQTLGALRPQPARTQHKDVRGYSGFTATLQPYSTQQQFSRQLVTRQPAAQITMPTVAAKSTGEAMLAHSQTIANLGVQSGPPSVQPRLQSVVQRADGVDPLSTPTFSSEQVSQGAKRDQLTTASLPTGVVVGGRSPSAQFGLLQRVNAARTSGNPARLMAPLSQQVGQNRPTLMPRAMLRWIATPSSYGHGEERASGGSQGSASPPGFAVAGPAVAMTLVQRGQAGEQNRVATAPGHSTAAQLFRMESGGPATVGRYRATDGVAWSASGATNGHIMKAPTAENATMGISYGAAGPLNGGGTSEADLARIADEVYAMIERRLVIEREALGL